MKQPLLKLIVATCLVVGAYGVNGEQTALARNCNTPDGCRSFMQATLRSDLSAIYQSVDYRIQLETSGQGNAPGSWFTAAWLSVNLAQGDPAPFPDKFTQVGIKTNATGTFWFVESEAGVTCAPGIGTQVSWRLCQGSVNQFVAPNNWSYVELVTYVGVTNYWIARVYEPNGTPHDVATIASTSGRVYLPHATFEEAYNTISDPYYNAYFYFKHPQYLLAGTGFQEWATSVGSGADSYIYPTDLDGNNTFCPLHYGIGPYVNGDSRAWYAGSYAQQCQWLLFPSSVTYQPDFRTVSGWSSTVTVLNNTTSSARVDVAFFDGSGALCDLSNLTLSGHASQSFAGCPGISAIVNADRDVRVVVQNSYDDGTRSLARAYPGETQPATTVYVPYAVRNWFTSASWRQTTDLVIQNTGTQPANVSVTFYDSWGAYGGSNTVNANNIPALGNIPPLGQVVVPGTAMSIWEAGSSNSLSSAVVQSTQPVAVVAMTLTGVADVTGAITTAYLAGDYRAFTSAANSVYLPVAAREYYTYNSSPQVQNTSSSNTTVRIRFYANGASTPALDTTQVIGPYQSINLWHPAGLPDNFLGSALITVNSGGPIVAMAQYDRFDAAHALYGVMQYEGVTAGTQTNVLAHVQKTSPWTYTGIQAQNMGGSSTSVTESYYASSGGSAGTSVAKTAPSSSAVNFWTAGPEIPAGLDGSAVSGSNPGLPLAVITNFDRLGDTAWTNRDGLLGYSAVK